MGQFSIAGISNNAVVQVSLTGSLLTLTGLTPGTSSVTVCQVGSQCAVTSVNVVATTTAPTAQTVLAVPVALGGSISIPISGSAAPYYVTQLTTGFLNASVLGNVLTVNGVAQGTSPLTVCSVNGGCSSLTFVVVPQLNASAPVILPAATLASAMNGVALVFSRAMAAGEESDDVMTLQKKLHDEGFFNGTYSRKYGSLTMTAVKKYQKAHGLTQTGNVGPSTRAALNK
jgi:hypothetical protein